MSGSLSAHGLQPSLSSLPAVDLAWRSGLISPLVTISHGGPWEYFPWSPWEIVSPGPLPPECMCVYSPWCQLAEENPHHLSLGQDPSHFPRTQTQWQKLAPCVQFRQERRSVRFRTGNSPCSDIFIHFPTARGNGSILPGVYTIPEALGQVGPAGKIWICQPGAWAVILWSMTLSRFNPFKLCFPAPFTSSKILGRLRHCPWTQVPEILRANELPKDLKPNKMCLTLCHWCGPSRVCTRGRMIVNHILFPHLRERFRALLTLY